MDRAAREGDAWRLAAESIVVRIRWFGVAMGIVLVQTRQGLNDPSAVRWFLTLGAGYSLLDTVFFRAGRVFLGSWPLFVSAMEAIFIALLCYHDVGLESPFRWYYLLSLICAAIRYRPVVAWWTFGFDAASLLALTWALGPSWESLSAWGITMAILAWTTWATSALASLLGEAGQRLRAVNAALERNRQDLERRVEERTEALRTAQARVLHQEKMAAFGLLAAGIAHEVGNPLAAISSLVQMLQRRNPDSYTMDKLDLAGRQLDRIRRTIRELVDYSRPATTSRTRVGLDDVVSESLGIAKYYHRTKQRHITTELPEGLSEVLAVRDHLTQVVLNLLLNALDATEQGGQIHLAVRQDEGEAVVRLEVEDDGRGVPAEFRDRLFQPYSTTKPRGTGLGLYVCRQMIEEHGGTIRYEPREEGGSRFVVSLPAVRLDALVSLPHAKSNTSGPLPGATAGGVSS
jgi:signal transduction histidine kinase